MIQSIEEISSAIKNSFEDHFPASSTGWLFDLSEICDEAAKRIFESNQQPTPLDHWIFYAEKLPLKSGWYETKDSGDDKAILFHGGGGLQNQWWKDESYVEKFDGFISYWRPVQVVKNDTADLKNKHG